jgi:Ni/Co efflux regulator RcnB
MRICELRLVGMPIVLATALSLAAGPAFSEKPEWAGEKGKGHGHNEEHGKDEHGRKHFEDRHRVAIHDYYAEEFHGGRCPPGLAKKHNGCMPPGQAKKWDVGHPLPHDVVMYDLPPTLVVKIGAPPAGYRYVRVASDILLIAVGTNMVVDAIRDLGRR